MPYRHHGAKMRTLTNTEVQNVSGGSKIQDNIALAKSTCGKGNVAYVSDKTFACG